MDSAPRRTWLAAERTYLAWLRTAFAALALALAVGRLLPALIAVSHVAFGLVGAGYGVFGVFLLALGAYSTQRVRSALACQQAPAHRLVDDVAPHGLRPRARRRHHRPDLRGGVT